MVSHFLAGADAVASATGCMGRYWDDAVGLGAPSQRTGQGIRHSEQSSFPTSRAVHTWRVRPYVASATGDLMVDGLRACANKIRTLHFTSVPRPDRFDRSSDWRSPCPAGPKASTFSSPPKAPSASGTGRAIRRACRANFLARSVPFVIASGYDEWPLPVSLMGQRRLRKPLTQFQLVDAIKAMCRPPVLVAM